jgi:hypothetical protein
MTDDRMDEIIRDAARDYNRPPASGAPREEIWSRVQRARQTPRSDVTPVSGTPRREWLWRGIGVAAVLAIGIGIGQYVERTRSSRQDSSAARQVASTPDSVRAPSAPTAGETLPPVDSIPAATAPSTRGTTRELALGPTPSTRSPRAPSSVGATVVPDLSSPRVDQADGLALRLALVKHLAGTEAMLTSFRTSARSGDVDAQLLVWARDLLRTTRLLQTSAASTHDPALRRLMDDLELVLLQISQYTAKASDHAQELELIEQSIEKRGVIAKLRTTTTPAAFPAGT